MSYDSPLSRRTVLASAAGLALALATPVTASAASLGYTDDGTNYVVDTGAGLVFKVNHSNGDLSSFVYNGTQYQGYDGKNSHIESGLGAWTVTISTPHWSRPHQGRPRHPDPLLRGAQRREQHLPLHLVSCEEAPAFTPGRNRIP
jgi:hypothetical protein